MHTSARHGHGSRGFTLIEMMIVVVIIAVLGFAAVGAWRKHLDNTRKSEVASMFAEIRAREEAYRAEFSAYLSTGASEDDLWPTLGAGEPRAKAWAPAPAAWSSLGVRPPGTQVYCAYSVMAGDAGTLPDGARGKRAFNNVAPTSPWWYATGTCDNDGDAAVNVIYVTTSESQTLSETNPHR